MKSVDDTLSIWRRGQFEWGKTDCIMSVCEHIQRATGIDPGAKWRGTYSTEQEAQTIAAEYGGTLGIFRHMMEWSGFKESTPSMGQPISLAINNDHIIGIHTGDGCAFRLERGCFEMKTRIQTSWEI